MVERALAALRRIRQSQYVLHHHNTSLVQPVDSFFRRDADRRNEQLCFAGNDDIHEFAELTVGIIVLYIPAYTFRVSST